MERQGAAAAVVGKDRLAGKCAVGADRGQLGNQLADLGLLGDTVSGCGVGCINSQLTHPLQNRMHLIERTLSSLHKTHTILSIPNSLTRCH